MLRTKLNSLKKRKNIWFCHIFRYWSSTVAFFTEIRRQKEGEGGRGTWGGSKVKARETSGELATSRLWVLKRPMAGPSTNCVLLFSKSPSLQDATTMTTSEQPPCWVMLTMGGYPNPNLVAKSMSVNKLAAVTFLCKYSTKTKVPPNTRLPP